MNVPQGIVRFQWPPPLPSETKLNCELISVITVLRALTRLLIAVVSCVASGFTLTVTAVEGDADARLSVTPLITLLTVLLALLVGKPPDPQKVLRL